MTWTRRKTLLFGSLAALVGSLPASVAGQQTPRSVVVYFSRTGNTRTVVDHIAARLQCDVVELQTREPYPEDYETLVDLVRDQAAARYLPPLATEIDLAGYERVFVGSPIWGNRLSRPVHSFLASHDLSGKIVAPFVTYQVSSSGGEAPYQLQQLCAGSDVIELLTVLGEDAAAAEGKIDAWLDAQVRV